MKVVLAGGTGAIGELLARRWHERGEHVTVLSRSPRAAPWATAAWDGRAIGPWAASLDGADVVVNLAGRSVNCRYHDRNRAEILASRLDSTRTIGEAIARAARPPRVWLQSSTATIYAHRYDAPNDEIEGIVDVGDGAPPSWRFSIEVARAWEKTCEDAATPQTRKVLLRSAMVMNRGPGSIFETLLTLVRRGLGGAAGDGRQYVSWIHGDDFVAALDLLIARDDLAGAVNICSPLPLPNAEFMRDLRDAAGARVGLPAPAPLLELGAIAMRTETELLLKSRRVVPRRLLEAGFRFRYPAWAGAAAELCSHGAGGGAASLVEPSGRSNLTRPPR